MLYILTNTKDMKRTPIYLLISLMFISCSLFNSDNEGDLTIELNPDQVQIEENPTLVIENMTATTIRYHCGHTVEVYNNGEWETATTTGCANSFPVVIEPNDSHSIPLSLHIEETGTYRAIIFISVEDGDDWVAEQRVTNSVQVTE